MAPQVTGTAAKVCQDWRTIEAAYGQIAHTWSAIPDDDGDALDAFVGVVVTYLGIRGLFPTEIAWIERTLVVAKEPGKRATLLNNLGYSYSALGEKARALEYFEQALPLRRQVGNRRGEAVTLNNIGLVYADLGEQARALAYYEQALELGRQVGDRLNESATRINMALVAADLGDLDRAVRELEQAVALDEALGHPDLASDRAALERMRARRDAAAGGAGGGAGDESPA